MHLQVQKHILESLLRLQWPSQSIANLPEHFVVDDVLQVFCKGIADSHAFENQLAPFGKLASTTLSLCKPYDNGSTTMNDIACPQVVLKLVQMHCSAAFFSVTVLC